MKIWGSNISAFYSTPITTNSRFRFRGNAMPLGSSTKQSHILMRAGRRLLGYLIDLAAFSLSAFVAFGLRFDGKPPSQFIHPWATATCIWALTKSMAFLIARVSWGHWRFTSTHEVVRIVLANLLGSLLGGSCILL